MTVRLPRAVLTLLLAAAVILVPGHRGGAAGPSHGAPGTDVAAAEPIAADGSGSGPLAGPVTGALAQPGSGPLAQTASGTAGRPVSTTLLATLHGTIPQYASPGGPQTGQVPGTWHGAPSILPVIATQAGWLDVRLAQRPDGSTAWVRASDVTLNTTPYLIVVDLATAHLTLYRDGRPVLSFPAGVGATTTPTPTGQFFVAFFARPPAAGYGPFIMVTSAHSNVLTDWEMSGDAMVAIHGSLGADAAIGTSGAHISHGCIRLHASDLVQLRNVPAGSPVIIVPR